MTEQRGERSLIDLHGWTVLGVRRGEDGQWRARYLCTDGGERRCFVVCPVRCTPATLARRAAEVVITRGTDGVPVVVVLGLVQARTRRYQPQPPGLRRHLWAGAGRAQGRARGQGRRRGCKPFLS